jgi:hypothetical protein
MLSKRKLETPLLSLSSRLLPLRDALSKRNR